MAVGCRGFSVWMKAFTPPVDSELFYGVSVCQAPVLFHVNLSDPPNHPIWRQLQLPSFCQ